MTLTVPMGNGINDRRTPRDLFDKLNAEFHFNLDAAASHENALCETYSTLTGTYNKGAVTRGPHLLTPSDGLEFSWRGKRVFCNPPYGRGLVEPWVEKAAYRMALVSVLLLPVRTEQRWFRNWVWNGAENRPYGGVEIRFLPHRLKFDGEKQGAPFPSMLVIFRQ